MREKVRDVTAKFIGRDGSMGFKNGQVYDLWYYHKGNYHYLSKRHPGATAIPYVSVAAVRKNWDFNVGAGKYGESKMSLHITFENGSNPYIRYRLTPKQYEKELSKWGKNYVLKFGGMIGDLIFGFKACEIHRPINLFDCQEGDESEESVEAHQNRSTAQENCPPGMQGVRADMARFDP